MILRRNIIFRINGGRSKRPCRTAYDVGIWRTRADVREIYTLRKLKQFGKRCATGIPKHTPDIDRPIKRIVKVGKWAEIMDEVGTRSPKRKQSIIPNNTDIANLDHLDAISHSVKRPPIPTPDCFRDAVHLDMFSGDLCIFIKMRTHVEKGRKQKCKTNPPGPK